jgi:hypothetical protein
VITCAPYLSCTSATFQKVLNVSEVGIPCSSLLLVLQILKLTARSSNTRNVCKAHRDISPINTSRPSIKSCWNGLKEWPGLY